VLQINRKLVRVVAVFFAASRTDVLSLSGKWWEFVKCYEIPHCQKTLVRRDLDTRRLICIGTDAPRLDKKWPSWLPIGNTEEADSR